MPQNPFLDDPPQGNPFLIDDAAPSSNPFLDDADTAAPAQQMGKFSALGKVVDPIYNAGSTAVSKIFNALDTPQNALQGAVAEGLSPTGKGMAEGFRQGLTREIDYSTKDVLDAAGWKDDSWTRAGVGLAGDLILDPLNLVGVGGIKSAYQAGVKALGTGAREVAKATPGVKTVLKGVESFVDPHAYLKDGTPGLKDAARLAESGARAIGSKVDQEVAETFATKTHLPNFFGNTFVTPLDIEKQRKLSYAIDEGKVATLPDDVKPFAEKFTKKLDEQWDSEVFTEHQVDPRLGGVAIKGKIVPGSPKLDNYFPYTTKPLATKNVSAVSNLKGTTRFSQKRDLESLKESVEHGGTDIASEALRTRLLSGRRAQHSADVVEKFASDFGSMEPKAGFRKLNIPDNVNLPKGRAAALSNVHVPEDVANYVEQYHTVISKPDELDTAVKNAVKVFKGWLVTTPQQGVTNLLGNVFNAFVSGNGHIMRPDRMKEAYNIVMNGKAFPAIGKYSSEEIKRAMELSGAVGGTGQYHDIVGKSSSLTFKPWKTNNAFSKATQFANQHVVEEPFKVAIVLDRLRAGKSLDEASLAHKETFFDYAEVSPFAAKLRDYGVAPFITWQLKNIPFQMKNLALNPQKYAQIESMYDAADDDDTIVPHKDEREGLVPIGPDQLLRIASPMNDLNKIPIPGLTTGDDFMTDTLGGMVPWFKAPLELANSTGRAGETGKQFYSGQPIARANSEGTVPMNTLTQLAQLLGIEGALGVSEGSDGYPKQNEYVNYALQQMPWQYYGRNFLPTPEELVETGKIESPSVLEAASGLMGLRTKDITPKAKLKELERRINQMQP
jgi:hypothetical protein